ncbi:condensation domain-containing protein, partial [Flavobacterium sp. H122]|uniref:condensation domain-containing protein n=1 Tax=Flavobacterium sp. H122 TaxID=2529860 RepID=UPI0010AA55EE
TDLIVGTPVAGREHPDLENQVGLYLNTLAVRTQLEEQNTFVSILEKQKQTLLGAYEHQHYQFDELVSKLNLKKDTGRSALFDVMVVFQNH